MGFKKTSEGRVYFQGSDEPNNKLQDNQKAQSYAKDKKTTGKPKTKPLTKKPVTKTESKIKANLANDKYPSQRFDSVDDDKNTQDDSQKKLKAKSSTNELASVLPKNTSPQTQIQIVALLKSLNKRLEITQTERNKMAKDMAGYKDLIEDLKGKADKSELAYKGLEKKLVKTVQDTTKKKSEEEKAKDKKAKHAEILARDALKEAEETRKLIKALESKTDRADQGVHAIKKMQLEHAEKMQESVEYASALTTRIKDYETRQEEIGTRVDDAVSQQARLTRKIEKTIEDRARFLRKLEHIETAVVQTRDSLNARANTLLTDQNHNAQNHDTIEIEDTQSPYSFDALMNKETALSRNLRIFAFMALLLAGLLGGWIINEWLSRDNTTSSTTDLSAAESLSPLTPIIQDAPEETVTATADIIGDIPALEWEIQDKPQTVAALEAATKIDATQGLDIADLDTPLESNEAVEIEMDAETESLAAALNAIEPGETIEENAPETTEEAAPETTQKTAEEIESIKTVSIDTTDSEQLDIPSDAYVPPAKTVTEQAPEPVQEQQQAQPQAAKPNVNYTPVTGIKSDLSLPDPVKKIENAALGGNPEAQHDLAAIYTAGHAGVKQDYGRAAFWFQKAADGGVANAAYNLGVLNHQGLGVTSNLETALNWYERASSLGHPEAGYNLGIAYIEGIGVPYDAKKAAAYFKNAAQNGIMEAAYNLGLIYENGLLGKSEPDKALAWYKIAADQGSPEAKEALEQLAASLGIKLEDVNRLAEGVVVKKNSKSSALSPANKTTPTNIGSNQQTLAQIQQYLIELGLYPGPADGINGPLTADAIRSYQKMYRLKANGQPTPDLLSHMQKNATDIQ